MVKPAIIGMRSLDQILVHISYYTHFTILGCTANLSLDPPFRSSLHPSLLSRESSSAVRSSFISLSVLDLSPKIQRGAAVFLIFSNAGLPTLDRRRVGRLLHKWLLIKLKKPQFPTCSMGPNPIYGACSYWRQRV